MPISERPLQLGTVKQWAILNASSGKVVFWNTEPEGKVPMVFDEEAEAVHYFPIAQKILKSHRLLVAEVVTKIGLSKQTERKFMGKCDRESFTLDEVAEEAAKISDNLQLAEAAQKFRDAKLEFMEALVDVDFKFG